MMRLLKVILDRIHLSKDELLNAIKDMDINGDECISLWEIYKYVKK